MPAVVSVLAKMKLNMKKNDLLQEICVYFHSSILVQNTTPAQWPGMWDFGVQHLLMLIWKCSRMVTVMTCVHLKVRITFVLSF